MKQWFMKALLLSIWLIPLFSYDQKFMDFVLNMAHKKNFYNCDNAIKEVFKNVGGSDIRVDVAYFPEIKDSLRITATFGNKGDSIYIYTIIRKFNHKCYIYENVMLTSSNSCIEYQNKSKSFNYISGSTDFYWFQNKGGINMILKPLNNGCIATYNMGITTPQN